MTDWLEPRWLGRSRVSPVCDTQFMETKTKRQVGDEAEELVVEHYEREGWTVRDRNVLSRRGEVDIVAEKGEALAFVEVRMRATDVWGDPSLTVGRGKQRRVVLAALQYLQRQRLMNRAIQFDVASVVGKGRLARVEIIPDAFESGF